MSDRYQTPPGGGLSDVEDAAAAPPQAQRRGADTDGARFELDLLSAIEAAFRMARAAGLDPDAAADVVQEASLRAWRHRAGRRGEFRPWFLRIVWNEARRRRRPWWPLSGTWSTERSIPFESGLRDELAGAFAHLNHRQRTALWLHYGEDLSVADVASALGLSSAAAKQLIHRGRERLRSVLRT